MQSTPASNSIGRTKRTQYLLGPFQGLDYHLNLASSVMLLGQVGSGHLRLEVNERNPMKRVIGGISGASGTIYGVRLLESLRDIQGIETHLILTRGARIAMEYESSSKPQDVEALADEVHSPDNLATFLSSGSLSHRGYDRGTMLHEKPFHDCQFTK